MQRRSHSCTRNSFLNSQQKHAPGQSPPAPKGPETRSPQTQTRPPRARPEEAAEKAKGTNARQPASKPGQPAHPPTTGPRTRPNGPPRPPSTPHPATQREPSQGGRQERSSTVNQCPTSNGIKQHKNVGLQTEQMHCVCTSVRLCRTGNTNSCNKIKSKEDELMHATK